MTIHSDARHCEITDVLLLKIKLSYLVVSCSRQYLNIRGLPYTVFQSTVFIRIEAQASIFYKRFLTQHLNETGIYLNPGVNFLLFTCPG